MKPRVTFYYAPHSRASVTLSLLEELGVEYDMHVLSLRAGTQRQQEYLAINPMGKVPAIRHGNTVVTEQPAVMMYLADLYSEAGLAPPIGDPRRGAYLRWMVFYGSCFEPAVGDRAQQREPGPREQSPYGTYDEVLGTLTDHLWESPYMLGDDFSAADVLWGRALEWVVGFNLVSDEPVIRAYIDRVCSRPAMRRAAKIDAGYAAREQEAVPA
ncbi:MAG TPA: glutathione S-transferase family protein [Gammaproteobacteria bacterium]|nr:glutathione S-transferase family protein [Gammaproteobacteria bacterium]